MMQELSCKGATSRARNGALIASITVDDTSGSTLGRSVAELDVLRTPVSSPVRSAQSAIGQMDDIETQVSAKAQDILRIIQEMIELFQRRGFELDHLPPLHASAGADGSIMVEWAFSDFRIGLSVDPVPDDSSWYLVSSESLGAIAASGYLSGIELQKLLLWLVSFAVSNS